VEATKAHIRSSRVAPGFDEVLLPGEPERRSAEARARDGIPVDDTTWRDICAAAGTLGITEAEITQAAGTNRA
jgi:hydroxycarboxylate dehydrogenase B